MKFRKSGAEANVDYTPMIDITFQLMSFFMFIINFSEAEQDERIQLPESELAKPAESALDYPITLQMTKDGTVIIAGQLTTIDGLQPFLAREVNLLEVKGRAVSAATVIVRAHRNAPTGKVQDLIKACQQNRFEKFVLRAQELIGA